jgi:hypothetical protein
MKERTMNILEKAIWKYVPPKKTTRKVADKNSIEKILFIIDEFLNLSCALNIA